jgi:O-antigen ligase
MSSGAPSRRILLWTVFVVFCTITMIDASVGYTVLPVVGKVSYFQVLLLGAGLLGFGTLLRVGGDPRRSGARTMCRIIIAYLLFELLVVIPVAVWLDRATLPAILNAMSVRFTWLLFPVVLTLCADERARRVAGAVAVLAAACLAVWGVYSAATGGGGYYFEEGVSRWRVLSLGFGGLLLFAWPLVLALSRAAPRRYTAALLGISLVGLALTNSRSGLIAFAIAGLACIAMSGQIRRLVPWIVPAGLIAMVVGFLWGQQATGAFSYTLSHLFDVGSGNGADRLTRWRLAWDFFASRPFNDYVWSWRYYLVHLNNPYEPHNFVFQIGVYEGVAGLIFYGSVLTTALRGAWNWGRKDAEARVLIGYLIAYLVFCLLNTNWYGRGCIPLLIAAVAGLVARADQLRAADESRPPGAEVFANAPLPR